MSPGSSVEINKSQIENNTLVLHQQENISRRPEVNNRGGGRELNVFGDDGLSFWDILDVINPLQHIPVLSTLYRTITNDQIDPAAKMVGGALYGGSIGLVSSIVDVVINFGTGKDLGGHALTLMRPELAKSNLRERPYYKEQEQEQSVPDYYSTMSNPYLASASYKDILPKSAQKQNMLNIFYTLPLYRVQIDGPAHTPSNKTETLDQFNGAVTAYQRGFKNNNGTLINSAS